MARVPPAPSQKPLAKLPGDARSCLLYTSKQLFSQGLAALGKDRPESLTVLCPEGSEGYLSELMQLWQRDLNFFPVQAAAQPLSEVEALVDAGNFDIALMSVTSTQNLSLIHI